jgi:hypothetical protein
LKAAHDLIPRGFAVPHFLEFAQRRRKWREGTLLRDAFEQAALARRERSVCGPEFLRDAGERRLQHPRRVPFFRPSRPC